MGIRIKALLVAMIMLVLSLPVSAQASELGKLTIVEVKLGGAVANQPTEFVRIFNSTSEVINLDGHRLEYAKSSALIDCQTANWKQQDSTNVREVLLTGTVNPMASAVIAVSMNDNAAGSLRLSKGNEVINLVGWSKDQAQPRCSEGSSTIAPVNTKSLMRHADVDGVPIDSGNNGDDFMTDQEPLGALPQKVTVEDLCINLEGVQATLPEGYQELADVTCEPIRVEEGLNCSVLSLSEIVPNPAGSDSGAEFVELYNPANEAVILDDCQLVINGQAYELSGVAQPGYHVVYGITLPNASGATVEYISPSTEDVTTYPVDLADDESWSLIGGTWQITNQPTPAFQNRIAIVTVTSTDTSTLAACPEGKYRNPETNRCKSYDTSSDLAPCLPGQERNPETNRCRKINVANLTTLKPCDAGQERNPATNRCRKIANQTDLKPCKEGQERNPETNRCRNVAAATTSTPSADSAKPATSNGVSYGLFAALAFVAGGYGIYEYRTEIGRFFSRLRPGTKK